MNMKKIWKQYDNCLQREIMNPKSGFSKWFEKRNSELMKEDAPDMKAFRQEAKKKDFDGAFSRYFQDWGDQDWDSYVQRIGVNDKSISDAIAIDEQLRDITGRMYDYEHNY